MCVCTLAVSWYVDSGTHLTRAQYALTFLFHWPILLRVRDKICTTVTFSHSQLRRIRVSAT